MGETTRTAYPEVETGSRRQIAMLLSCDSFEKFFGGNFGLDRDSYIQGYRNDFSWSYGEALLARGHSVTIYVFSFGKAEIRTAPNGLKIRFIPIPRWERWTDSLLFRLQHLPGGNLRRDRVALQGVRAALQQALASDAIDLFYVQEFWTARCVLLLQMIDLPTIVADHGAQYTPELDDLRKTVFPRAVKMICQTQENLDRVRALGGNAVLIPNGVDDTFFTPDPDHGDEPRPRAPTVLSVGRLTEPQKRFSDLIHAIKLLPAFNLVLVGTGPDEVLLKDLAKQLGIADRVSFPGFVRSREDLRTLYRMAGVFVSSSAWEAVALVVLEAMSCGTPVVITRIPSFEALLPNGFAGQLVPIGDPAALAAAIQTAHSKADVYGPRARARVAEAYSAERLYDQLSDLIRASPLPS